MPKKRRASLFAEEAAAVEPVKGGDDAEDAVEENEVRPEEAEKFSDLWQRVLNDMEHRKLTPDGLLKLWDKDNSGAFPVVFSAPLHPQHTSDLTSEAFVCPTRRCGFQGI